MHSAEQKVAAQGCELLVNASARGAKASCMKGALQLSGVHSTVKHPCFKQALFFQKNVVQGQGVDVTCQGSGGNFAGKLQRCTTPLWQCREHRCSGGIARLPLSERSLAHCSKGPCGVLKWRPSLSAARPGNGKGAGQERRGKGGTGAKQCN